MIYTSYFANMDNINKVYEGSNRLGICVSICGKAPDWYLNNGGVQFKKLAPKYDFFMKWKESGDNDYYVSQYYSRVLSMLSPLGIVRELYQNLVLSHNLNRDSDFDIILLCYEKPGDFCHRHLVSKWFNDAGIDCKEFPFDL